jgi:type II secretion system protein N
VSPAPAVAAPFPLLPRSPLRRALAIAAAYLALTGLFVIARFPIDRLTPRVEALATAATGARVEIGSLGMGVIALLPALHAREVAVATAGGTRLRFDRVRARPAWSLSWLRGHPSLALSLRAGEARLDGIVRLGSTPGFRGDFSQVDLRQIPALPLEQFGVSLDGRLAGELDLRLVELGLEGTLALRAADGSLGLPDLPIAIPFESIVVDATLGGDALAEIGSLVVDGPMVAMTASGTVSRGPTPALALAPLALRARLQVREPALREMMAGSGLALGPDGVAELAIGGTLGAPALGGSGTPAGVRGAAPARGAARRPAGRVLPGRDEELPSGGP